MDTIQEAKNNLENTANLNLVTEEQRDAYGVDN
jgi:hypothetical protein